MISEILKTLRAASQKEFSGEYLSPGYTELKRIFIKLDNEVTLTAEKILKENFVEAFFGESGNKAGFLFFEPGLDKRMATRRKWGPIHNVRTADSLEIAFAFSPLDDQQIKIVSFYLARRFWEYDYREIGFQTSYATDDSISYGTVSNNGPLTQIVFRFSFIETDGLGKGFDLIDLKQVMRSVTDDVNSWRRPRWPDHPFDNFLKTGGPA